MTRSSESELWLSWGAGDHAALRLVGGGGALAPGPTVHCTQILKALVARRASLAGELLLLRERQQQCVQRHATAFEAGMAVSEPDEEGKLLLMVELLLRNKRRRREAREAEQERSATKADNSGVGAAPGQGPGPAVLSAGAHSPPHLGLRRGGAHVHAAGGASPGHGRVGRLPPPGPLGGSNGGGGGGGDRAYGRICSGAAHSDGDGSASDAEDMDL